MAAHRTRHRAPHPDRAGGGAGDPTDPADHREQGHRLRRAAGWLHAWVVVTGRWLVVAAWVVVAVYLTLSPPSTGGGGGGAFDGILPPDSAALQVEDEVNAQFPVPIIAGTTVVVHDPGGLGVLTQADAVLFALATTQDAVTDAEQLVGTPHVVGAIPVPTADPATFVTFLYMSPHTGAADTVRVAQRYAAHFDGAGVDSYVTGFIPAQAAQARLLTSRLPIFEGASVLLVVGIVALVFRSWAAPVVVLVTAGVAYLVYSPLLDLVADVFGFVVPGQLEPLMVALLIGVVTDYCVLLFSSYREELGAQPHRLLAARRAVRRDTGVIAVAGLTVAGGTISLLAAPYAVFQSLGPALALTVLVGVAVCLTLAPAAMSIAGSRMFSRRSLQPHAGSGGSRFSAALVRPLTRRGGAALAFVAVVGGLVVAALPVTDARLGLSFTAGLPADDPVSRGAAVLEEAGVRGVAAPTEVLVQGPGVADQRAALERLQESLADQARVVQVLGPATSPLDQGFGIVLSEEGDAARYIVVFDSDPLGARAIAGVEALQRSLPSLAREAGLTDVDVALTGQTSIAAEVADLTQRSLWVVLLTAFAVELVILVLYLRAVLAPVVLLLASFLSVAAALGLTTLVFQGALGQESLIFYAPFATAVLLVALGSDYNVFAVGGIWAEARRRPMRQALAVAVPRSSQAITAAGFILAATFAMTAIIPLGTFREIAFTMAVGLLLDTLLVRPVLTPAMLTLLGRAAVWPNRRLRRVAGAADGAAGAAGADGAGAGGADGTDGGAGAAGTARSTGGGGDGERAARV